MVGDHFVLLVYDLKNTIFSVIMCNLVVFSQDNLHTILQHNLQRLKSTLNNFTFEVSRSHIVPQRKHEIQMLRLYDPDLEEQ